MEGGFRVFFGLDEHPRGPLLKWAVLYSQLEAIGKMLPETREDTREGSMIQVEKINCKTRGSLS